MSEVRGAASGSPGWPDPTSSLPSPLEAIGVLASSDVMVTPTLRHVEMYTLGGLLALLWHQPPVDARDTSTAIVACGGAMGGLLGPGDALYHRLGETWSSRGVPMIRVSYRRPNDMDACCLDLAAAVQMVATAGAQRVVLMGHSFGGAVAVRVGVVLPEVVTGVVTFATQSAGCEVAAGLEGRPLLLFHGDRDEILPHQSSEMVRLMAGSGEFVMLPGDGHLLAKSDAIIEGHLERWLPTVLGLP